MKKHNEGNAVVGRGFNNYEMKILGAALISSCLIFITACNFFEAQWAALHSPTNDNERRIFEQRDDLFPAGRDDVGMKQHNSSRRIIRSELRDIRGDIRIDPHSLTIYKVMPPDEYAVMAADDGRNNTSNRTSSTSSSSWTIKPYPVDDNNVGSVAAVTTWSVKMVSSENQPQHHDDLPHCPEHTIHDSPGIFFSLGGYAGNHFHGFADVLVPLFATARPFNREVELVVTDPQPWMVYKIKPILQALSRYDVVAIDKEQQNISTNNTSTGRSSHCFKRLILGLNGRHRRKELSINSSESEYTMQDFRHFLRTVYSLNKTTTSTIKPDNKDDAAQLVIMSRKKSRVLTNADQIAMLAASLGYKVLAVAEPDLNMSRTAEMINRCDVVVGVHGAGLTNMVFLPDNAVLIQVVPLYLDWQATTYYGEPTKDMGLRYLDYKIGKGESSLSQQYAPNDTVFTDPFSFEWEAFRSIYLENQNVTLDLQRFKPTLLKALEILRRPQ